MPGFRAGELYPLIEPTVPDVYVFAEVEGKRRCIDSRLFEVVRSSEPSPPQDRPLTGRLTGLKGYHG
jgi:hypothetical protein